MLNITTLDRPQTFFECYEDGVEVFKDKPLYIANGLMDGIEIEADLPRNYPGKKLSIPNMMVWIEDEVLYYLHYEERVSSKRLIPLRPTHAGNCKRSVHVEAVVTRCENTSRLLDWEKFFVPILQNYMVRMAQGGYPGRYRRMVWKIGIACSYLLHI